MKKLFNIILENMNTWLPISFRLIKFPLGFSSPCGFGMLFNCFRAQVGETTSWKLLQRNKSKPTFMFCFGISTKMDQCSSPTFLAFWNAWIIRLSACTLKVLQKAVMRKRNITQYHKSEGQLLSIIVSVSSVFGFVASNNWWSSALSHS